MDEAGDASMVVDGVWRLEVNDDCVFRRRAPLPFWQLNTDGRKLEDAFIAVDGKL